MFKALSRIASSFTRAEKTVPVETPEPEGFPIIVSRSAIEVYPDNPDPLVTELVDYVNALTRKGRYTHAEIPPRAIQAFHMQYYLAQVHNGGHAAFVRNCGDILGVTLKDIEAGLTECDAAEYRVVLHRFEAWLNADPAASTIQKGVEGGIDPALSKLDRIFHALEQKYPLREKIAGLIAEAPELLVVSDLKVDEARENLCAMNPHRVLRDRVLTISELEHELTDPFSTTLSLAAGRVEPLAAIAGIGAGSPREVDGRQWMCIELTTTEGKRWAVVQDDGIALHAWIGREAPAAAMPPSPPGATAVAAAWVGARLGQVATDEAAPVAAIARELKVAAAIDLLLSRLIQPPRVDHITIRSAGPDAEGVSAMALMLVLDDASMVMSVVVTEAEAVLLHEPDHKQTAKATRAEIDIHAASYAPDKLTEIPPE